MGLCDNLREAMSLKNFTTEQLSQKTGINSGTISSYLKTNGSMPPVDKALKIAEVLETSVEFLVYGFEKSKENQEPLDYKKFNRIKNVISHLNKMPDATVIPIIHMIQEMSDSLSDYEEIMKKNEKALSVAEK